MCELSWDSIAAADYWRTIAHFKTPKDHETFGCIRSNLSIHEQYYISLESIVSAAVR